MATGSARRARKNGRGGHREGTPGTAHSNRTDLNQPPSAAPNQPYGEAGAQLASQAAIPLPRAPGPSSSPTPSGAAAGGPAAQAPGGAPTQAAPMAPPGSLGPLNAPSMRPNEPLTAGLPSGPGPGPEALGITAPTGDPTVSLLQGVFAQYPTPAIQALLNQAQADATSAPPPPMPAVPGV